MSNFRNWYVRNQDAITWFIIGVCFMSGLSSLAVGNYTGAAINFGIAFLNYILSNTRLQ